MPGLRWLRSSGPHQRAPRRPAHPDPPPTPLCRHRRPHQRPPRERGLWKLLPDLSFRGIVDNSLEASLAQVVALPNLSLLDIAIPDRHTFSAEAVASLLRSAARLDPVEFSFSIAISWERPISIDVPPFSRARSIRLNANHPTTPPETCLSGEFPVLERLSITSGSLDFDTAAQLTSRCPNLRVLELVNTSQGLNAITVHSATIEELLVTSDCLRGVYITAPALKRFTLHSRVPADFYMTWWAPTVEDLSWMCPSIWWSDYVIGIDAFGMWCLRKLTLGTEEESGFVLGLSIGRPAKDYAVHARNLHGLFQFPIISVLELCLYSRGHVYGAVVLQLLRFFIAVRRLKLVITSDTWEDEACLPNCPCDEPEGWASQIISLMELEEVEIKHFKGSDHEVDFLKLLFRCAPLKKVTLLLASYLKASSTGCKEAYNVFMANPDVDCHVYRIWGKEVIYARSHKLLVAAKDNSLNLLSYHQN